MTTPQVPEQAAAAAPSPRGRRRQPNRPPQPIRTHAWIPGADGECWCPLPQDNRVHQVNAPADDVGARILGEHQEVDQ